MINEAFKTSQEMTEYLINGVSRRKKLKLNAFFMLDFKFQLYLKCKFFKG